MGETHSDGGRAITYCLIPRELARELHEPLRSHFSDDPAVEVVVERRAADRRGSTERRRDTGSPARERRRIRGLPGRRVGERRSVQVSAEMEYPVRVPRRLRRYAHRLVFVELILPSTQQREDDEAARLVVRYQGGEHEAFGQLYLLYFDSVYAYLRVLFRNDPHQAEDLTQQVFTNALAALGRYERRGQPFRAWLFVIARNVAFAEIGRGNRRELVEPAELARRHESGTHEDTNLEALTWISDRELVMLIERLPLAQRQVLLLRHMLDLSTADIARILGRTAVDVRKLEHRARGFLAARLTALGRAPVARRGRMPSRSPRRNLPVGRARRFALAR